MRVNAGIPTKGFILGIALIASASTGALPAGALPAGIAARTSAVGTAQPIGARATHRGLRHRRRGIQHSHPGRTHRSRCPPCISRNLMVSDDATTISNSGWLTSIINTETGVVTPTGKNYFVSTSNGSNPTFSVLFQTSPEPFPISVWNPTTGYTNVNVTSDGTPANGSNLPGGYNFSHIAQDGRYVVFSSIATNLVPGLPNNSNSRVFIFDLQA